MSSAKKKSSQQMRIASPAYDWMSPIRDDMPCGLDLEYDPEFVVLSAAVATRYDAQYGDFVSAPEPVNWTDVARDCQGLMMRTRDMRLAVLYTRCSTRLKGAAGLGEGLSLLAGWLTEWPGLIHPQPDVDEDRSVALEIRMNALQSLTDADGLLSDLREVALTRSTATRLQVRDVERAFAHPRPADALAPESVIRQIQELRLQHPDTLAGFDVALESMAIIEAWSREHLEQHMPDFSALSRLLELFKVRAGDHAIEPESTPVDSVLVECTTSEEVATTLEISEKTGGESALEPTVQPTPGTVIDRQAALNLMRKARHWFEQHEPSSPIPVLLRRAEQFVGKTYGEVVKAIPIELLAQWDSEQ